MKHFFCSKVSGAVLIFNGKGSLSTSFSKSKSGLFVSGRGPNSGLTSFSFS